MNEKKRGPYQALSIDASAGTRVGVYILYKVQCIVRRHFDIFVQPGTVYILLKNQNVSF